MKHFILIALFTVVQTATAATLYFEANPTHALVHISVAISGGSASDPEGKSGLTDITAKMLLRGTKQKTKSQIDLALDQMGSSIGMETRSEFLLIQGSVLSKNIQPFLNLLAELILMPSFRAADLDRLKNEQIASITHALNSDPLLAKIRHQEIFFAGHPYAKSHFGKPSEIRTLQIQDLKKHYSKMIQAKNILITASGDADEKYLAQFKDQLNQLPSDELAVTLIPNTPNSLKKNRIIILDKPNSTQTQVIVGHMGLDIHSADRDALMLANHVFGGDSFQSRLMSELRTKRGWTYGTGSQFKFAHHPHSWTMSFFPKNADTAMAVSEALKLFQNFCMNGISQAEFDHAQSSLINGSGFLYNSPSKRMQNLLTEKFYQLPDHYIEQTAQRLAALTRTDVNQAIRRHFNPNQLLITILGTSTAIRESLAKQLNVKINEIEVLPSNFL